MTAQASDPAQRTLPEQAALLVQRSLLRAIEAEALLAPAHETKVRNTLDHLRDANADPALLKRFETLSCTLAQLHHYRRQGRVNAYASTLRRLQQTARAA